MVDKLRSIARALTPRAAHLLLVAIASWGVVALDAGAAGDARAGDPIVGLWEGRKLDGRTQTTEPWGPFLIERDAGGSLSATFLGSRLGQRDRKMYEVRLDGDRFHLEMDRRGGAVLDAVLDRKRGLVGSLRHHGMSEDLRLERIPNRTVEDVMALFEAGGIAESPPSQSEWMSVLVHRGPDAARRIYEAARAVHPERQLWGPSAVNRYGYELINRNRTARAVAVLELNVLAYPDDANSFDSLGEALLRNGDRQAAVEALRTALSLNPRSEVKTNSIELLKELGVDVYKDGL